MAVLVLAVPVDNCMFITREQDLRNCLTGPYQCPELKKNNKLLKAW